MWPGVGTPNFPAFYFIHMLNITNKKKRGKLLRLLLFFVVGMLLLQNVCLSGIVLIQRFSIFGSSSCWYRFNAMHGIENKYLKQFCWLYILYVYFLSPCWTRTHLHIIPKNFENKNVFNNLGLWSGTKHQKTYCQFDLHTQNESKKMNVCDLECDYADEWNNAKSNRPNECNSNITSV